MAYRIDYSNNGMREEIQEKKAIKSKEIWPVAFICLILLMGILYPQKQTLERLLIPGNAETTKQATAQLVSDLRAGEKVTEALQTFCLEIIADADIS